MEEEYLFGIDDHIVLANDQITIIKTNDNFTMKQLNSLKEINGSWNIEFDVSPKHVVDQPDKWISDNQDKIYDIFCDIKEKSLWHID